MDRNTHNQAAYRARKGATHVKRNLWIHKQTDARLSQLASAKGWISTTGCNAGKPNMQQAIEAALSAGLDSLELLKE